MPNGKRQHSAGLILLAPDRAGGACVLAGRLPVRGTSRFGIRLDDCWAIPFGGVEPCDAGDFRRTAIREAAEEVVPGFGEGRTPDEAAAAFDAWAGIGAGRGSPGVAERVAASRECRTPAWATLAARLAGHDLDGRAYCVALPRVPDAAPSGAPWDWAAGTLAWRPVGAFRALAPQHSANAHTFARFADEIARAAACAG